MQKKKLFACVGAIIAVTAAVGLQFRHLTKESFSQTHPFTIICDAGHGAPDSGAVGVGGSLEKDINLSIVQKLQEILEGKGIEVILTRDKDEEYYTENSSTIRQKKVEDMKKRLEIMTTSNADLFITIHMNSFVNASAKGLNLFYDTHHEEIKPLVEDIQKSIAEVTGAQEHQVKPADEKLYLMKNPPLPSILIECGFISNPQEESKLIEEEYQAKIAWAIAKSVEKYISEQTQ